MVGVVIAGNVGVAVAVDDWVSGRVAVDDEKGREGNAERTQGISGLVVDEGGR